MLISRKWYAIAEFRFYRLVMLSNAYG